MKLNNLLFFFKYLKSENIVFDENEFKFQLETHPSYPSLLSFYDTLSFFNVESIATKIEDKDLSYLPDRFVSQIIHNNRPKLAFIEKHQDLYHVFINQKTRVHLTENHFQESWTGIVLAAEGEESNKVTNNSNTVLYALAAIFVLGTSFFSWIFACILALTLIGIFLSVEAIKQEFHIETNFSSRFCSAPTQKSDCSTIINSKKFKLFDRFSFTDVSIVFFTGQLFALTILFLSGFESSFLKLVLLSLGISVPITLVSLVYQWLIVKKWCTICLGIIFTLYIEILVIISYDVHLLNQVFQIETRPTFLYIFAFLTPLVLLIIVKPSFNEFFDLKSEYKKLYKFKRAYSLFKNTLVTGNKVHYENLDSKIKLGNPHAKLKLSLFTNPMCGHCKDLHFIIEKLIEKYSDQMQFNILFTLDIEKNEDRSLEKLHLLLVTIYIQKGEKEFLEALGEWFTNQDYELWFHKYKHFDTEDTIDKAIEILKAHRIKNTRGNIIFTPSLFIGQYSFPKSYERNDLELFMDDLLDDPDFSV